jgi:uncharacterized protein YjbJ (UPF0337 family)
MNTMNWSEIESGWTGFTASAKQQWAKLSDQQLGDTKGKREQLSLKLQEAYSYSKDESEREISEWQSRQAPAVKS